MRNHKLFTIELLVPQDCDYTSDDIFRWAQDSWVGAKAECVQVSCETGDAVKRFEDSMADGFSEFGQAMYPDIYKAIYGE